MTPDAEPHPPVTVRLLRAADAEALSADGFNETSVDDPAERVRDELAAQEAGTGLTLVAEVEGEVVATMRMTRHDPDGWIHNVAVLPGWRGRGIAGRLFEEMIERCRRVSVNRLLVHARRDNASAVRAYEKAGFRFAAADGMRGEQLRYERPI